MKKLFTVLSLVFMLSSFVLPVKASSYTFIYSKEGMNPSVWEQKSGNSCQLKVLEYDMVITVDGTFDMRYFTSSSSSTLLAINLNHYDYTYHVQKTYQCTTTDQAILAAVPSKTITQADGWGFRINNPENWGYPGIWFTASSGDNYGQVVPLLQSINGKLSQTNEDLKYIENILKTSMRNEDLTTIRAFKFFREYYNGVQNYEESDNAPYLTFSNFTTYSEYTAGKYIQVNPGQELYICFYSNKMNWDTNDITVYPNISDFNYEVRKTGSNMPFMAYQILRIKNTDTRNANITINFNKLAGRSDVKIVPLYVGFGDDLTTQEKSRFGIDENNVRPDVSSNNQTNSNFNTAAQDLIGQEDSWNNQMNQSINAIDFNSQVTNNTSFLGAANFLVTMFNLMTNNNPFGYFIIFFAIICIAKILIGRKKK